MKKSFITSGPGVHGVSSKGQILLNFHHKDFLYQILCAFSQKRYKTYRPDYPFCDLRHAQVV